MGHAVSTTVSRMTQQAGGVRFIGSAGDVVLGCMRKQAELRKQKQ